MGAEISVLSKEYVKVPVQSFEAGTSVDLSGATPKAVLKDPGVAPTSGDWKTASWETVSLSQGRFNLRLLVGPGGDQVVPVGTYDMWIRVTAFPQDKIGKASGNVVVY